MASRPQLAKETAEATPPPPPLSPPSFKGAITKGDGLLVGAPMLHIHELQATNHIVKNQNNHTRNRINANQ